MTYANGRVRNLLLANKENRRALHFYQKQGWTTTRLICLRKADVKA